MLSPSLGPDRQPELYVSTVEESVEVSAIETPTEEIAFAGPRIIRFAPREGEIATRGPPS